MVVIFLGSKSDLEWGKAICKYLAEFGISYKIHIASAHRTPDYLLKLIGDCEALSEPVIYICVAGRSNALGGFIDAQSGRPVINCPPFSEKYAGLDILSSLRMPSGVASMTVLEPEQAALAAVKILALDNKKLKEKVLSYQKKNREKIVKDDNEINEEK